MRNTLRFFNHSNATAVKQHKLASFLCTEQKEEKEKWANDN